MGNNVLVITGGTGSFGHAMLKYILENHANEYKEIRIFSRDEKKQHDMRLLYKDTPVTFHIGDVRDYDSVFDVMIGATQVFHAAAMKQVPACEDSPIQAIYTNIIGSNNVLRAACSVGVDKVVVLSTDKAVMPVNTMGMTKALLEKLAINYARGIYEKSHNTTICITRYGNVMGSRGSVLPLFIDQLKARKPVTITNPNMTRFMMSLDEAVKLVKYALDNGTPGCIYVRKAPATNVETMARAVAAILGDMFPDIQYIGSRPGEKLHETLVSEEEMTRSHILDSYIRILPEISPEDKVTRPAYTSDTTRQLTAPEVVSLVIKQPMWEEYARS